MPKPKVRWRTIATARERRDAARAAQQQARFDVAASAQAIVTLQRSAASDAAVRTRVAALEREHRKRVRSLATRTRALADAAARASALAGELAAADPQTLIGAFDDDTPILLLPLRLETRFGVTNGVRVLRVRMFPDDIAVTQHEKALTQAEVDAGHVYWNARIHANTLAGADKTDLVSGAFRVLAMRNGAYRASWIARATQPSNWSDALVDASQADFPAVQTKPASWTEAPRSFVLPDRFVVRLEAAGGVREIVGLPIPDDLPFGPDPLASEAAFGRDETTGRLVLDPQVAWMIDFAAAVKAGMALEIPLDLPREANGFDRVVVIGLRLSSEPADAAARIERMFEAHRYSRGMSIVPQGAPTNNTDAARSSLVTAAESIDQTLSLELDANALPIETDHAAKRDGQRLAEALSISVDAVRPLPFAANTDIAEALAMNRALWSATLGDFAADMLAPGMSAGTITLLRDYFTVYVTGRGLLPALRVGSEPYGVITTSALSLWTWRSDEIGSEAAFWNGLLARMRAMADTWNALASHVPRIGTPGDPFATLLAVIGLQASSVEFYARKATAGDYMVDYARFRGAPAAFLTALAGRTQQAIAQALRAAGVDPVGAAKLATLVFWREHDRLTGPVIDGDPQIAFSETQGIRTFDGIRNYVDWLATASVDDIRAQAFRDANGASVVPPAALFYRLLRDAFLAELARSARLAAVQRVPAVFAELPEEPTIANVAAVKTFSASDLLALDAAKIGVSDAHVTLADALVTDARAGQAPPPEAAGLADLHDALLRLARLPTARLERAFAEHIDLCSHRLDGWIEGLFARRLLTSRQRSPDVAALHVGSFGWVEDLRPDPARTVIAPDALPAALRDEAVGAVVDDPANGGFVHAPSLTHAATAAVLRNAYLSHADPEHADAMSVDLSSRRVRTAMGLIEGLRNGQELAALLGYQLERGLHEGHPGVELDAYVYVLRERFPFTSGKLTEVPAGTSAETLEARNVVNGYDLLETVKGRAYPYGIAGLPGDTPDASGESRAAAAAIRAEIERLEDALDAVADLVLAESVHQCVQGNYDRAKGALQAIVEGAVPPDPQVIETPRSGRSLTFRLALPLDVTKTAGWRAPLTPRAAANAPLNAWLASVLPHANAVQWQVKQGDAAPVFVSLASLALEPLDCVLMAGERLGELSSELERFLVHNYRVAHAVPDALPTVVRADDAVPLPGTPSLVFDPRAAAPGAIALASLMPMLKALVRIVTRSRALNARDFELAGEAQSNELANPQGYDDGAPPLKALADLKGRVEAGYAAFTNARDALRALLDTTVAPLVAALEADPAHAIDAQWAQVLTQLRTLMVRLCRVGMAEALPIAGLAVSAATIDALVAQAKTCVDLATARAAAAREALDTAFTPLPPDPAAAARERASRTQTLVSRYSDAAKAVFGATYNVLPAFRLHASARPEIAAAVAAPAASDTLTLEAWLQSLVRVRDATSAYATVDACAEWIGAALPAMTALQLPAHPGNPWIGTAYADALPEGETASIVLCAPLAAVDALQCGFMLDEWTELVPATRETTGIAFHFDRPNAAAPQAMLLAVAPRLNGAWNWTDLVAVIEETFVRAKMRAVEPDALVATPYFQALPAIVSEFSVGGLRANVWAQSNTAVITA